MSDFKKQATIDTLEYQLKRIAILKEINANKVSIDRSCFKQDKKNALKEAIKSYKKQKGSQSHETERASIANSILKNPMNCGNLIVKYI